MNNVLFSLISSLCFSFKSRAALQAEILALRHQIAVLQQAGRKRARFRPMDRIFWVWLSQLWDGWRSSIEIVKPETVIAWHRKGFRLYWRWKSRRPGRPDTKLEIRQLIRRMSKSNATWGAPRIHSELLKLGIDLSPTTVAGLSKDEPDSRAVQPPDSGRVVAIPQVGGLHHRYERRAA